MAKVLRSIMGRKEKPAPCPPPPHSVDTEVDDPDDRLQGDRNVNRRVSISRSGRYKQRNKRRSGIWDNPQLVHDGDDAGDDAHATEDNIDATSAISAPPSDDKENDDAGSVQSKDSVRSRGSSVLHDTSQVAQELMDLAEQQLRETHGTIVTNL